MARPKDLFTVVISAVLFCILGGLIGLVLGGFTPGYYRAVFIGGDSPTFDPAQVGFGLGTTQEFVGGTVIGLLLVLSQGRSQQIFQILRQYRWLLLVMGALLSAVCLLFSIAMRSMIHDHDQWMYRVYVEEEYLPDQKKLTGKWPTDLRGLPNYIKTQKRKTEDHDYDREWLDEVLRFHRNNYASLQPVQSSNKKYSFNLRLRRQTIECETTIDDTK